MLTPPPTTTRPSNGAVAACRVYALLYIIDVFQLVVRRAAVPLPLRLADGSDLAGMRLDGGPRIGGGGGGRLCVRPARARTGNYLLLPQNVYRSGFHRASERERGRGRKRWFERDGSIATGEGRAEVPTVMFPIPPPCVRTPFGFKPTGGAI